MRCLVRAPGIGMGAGSQSENLLGHLFVLKINPKNIEHVVNPPFLYGKGMVVSWDSMVSTSPSKAALAAALPFNSSAVIGTVCTVSMFTPECYQLLIATILFGFGPIPRSYCYQRKLEAKATGFPTR